MKLQDLLKAITLLLLVQGAAVCLSDSGGPDVDRQLPDNLDAAPLDGLDRELFGPRQEPSAARPAKIPAPKPAAAERPGDQIVRDLLQELRRADEAQRAAAQKQPDNADDTKPVPPAESKTAAAAQDNPLIKIARQMRDVERRIEKTDSGPATQKTQQQIIDQLERLIEQAQKSCCGDGKPGQKQSQGGTCERKTIAQSKKPSNSKSTGKGSSPGQSSGSAAVKEPAPPRTTDMQQMQALIKRLWGELPQRDREQMLQYPVEQFLPEYEQMIEEYYKRLSEPKEQ